MRALESSLSRPQTSRIWDGEDAENEFKLTCEPLKQRFLDFTQVAFRAGQEEENVFPVPGDHFLCLTQDELWAS